MRPESSFWNTWESPFEKELGLLAIALFGAYPKGSMKHKQILSLKPYL